VELLDERLTGESALRRASRETGDASARVAGAPTRVEDAHGRSCLADACLEERGVAWHPDPCALALASYLRAAGTLTAPTPHGFDEFLLDDIYRDDPRAFQPSTLLALFVLAPPTAAAGGR
jgi:hypothetical protein